jgi:DNA repair protein RadC
MKRMADLHKLDRPRERLLRLGAENLETQELLELIIGNGTRVACVRRIAGNLKELLEAKHNSIIIEDFKKISGVGNAKSCILMAVLELSKRLNLPKLKTINSAKDALPFLMPYAAKKQEHFLTLHLNGSHNVQSVNLITVGLLNSAQVHPREVFAQAIAERVSAIIIAHNHPSGNCEPSLEDQKVTTRLREAGNILGIKILDHIIFAENNYFSFDERGL